MSPDIDDQAKDVYNHWINAQSDEFKLWWKIRENGRKGRRVGNGFTALADMLAAMNLKYGSEEAKEFIANLMEIKMGAELDATIDMSILRGSFDGWDKDKECVLVHKPLEATIDGTNNFYQFIANKYPEQWYEMMNSGRRNISFSTCAPTGTTSLMTQTSSGIEPLFKPYYKRRVKTSNTEKYDFKSGDGQYFNEYLVVHPKLITFAKVLLGHPDGVVFTEEQWNDIYMRSPYYQCTANDLNWKDRIDTQAIIQQYVSHSISSTLNLPESTTIEEVDQIYRYANEKKLKGVTIYRDNSREGILVSTESVKAKIKPNIAPKRPKSLPASLCVIKSKGIKYAVIVGLLDEKPFEIFAHETEKATQNALGKIIKVSKGVYRFESDTYTCDNLQLANDKIEEKACTLYTSMLLRHGADIRFIVKTTRKVNDNITSFSAAMCRVLSQYIPKEKVKGEVCPDCGQPLEHEGGCVHCTSCTYSKCLVTHKIKKV